MAKKELVAVVKGDVSDFKTKMAQVNSSMQSMGQSFKRIGGIMSVAVTAPLAMLAKTAVNAYSVQEGAERKLAAAIKATGGDVDANMARFKKFASDLQAVTTTGDEVTLGMIQMAQTMGLSADQSERAARNAIAMEAAFGVSAASAMRYTAALEQGDATMLKRYIPALRDVTDESQLAARAQEILGNAFNVAQEDAKTFAGQTQQLKNSWGDLMEEFGKIMAQAITPLISKLKSIVSWFQSLDESTKKIIVGVGGLAAAIGPLLVSLGFLMNNILPALIKGGVALKTAWLPITAIVLGIYGAYRLFNTEAEKTNKIIESFKDKTDIQLELEKNQLSQQLDQQLKEAGFGDKLSLVFGASGDVFGKFLNDVRKRLGIESELEITMRRLKAINKTLEERKKAAEEIKKVNEEINEILNKQTTGLEPTQDADNTAEMGEPLEKLQAKVLEVSGVIATALPDAFKRAADKAKVYILDLTNEVTGLIVDSLSLLGNAIGEGLSGKEIGKEFIVMLADWGQRVGAIMLSAGLAIEAFKVSLSSLNGIALIIAGGALIVAASAVKGALKSGLNGGGGYSSYGSSGGGGGIGTVEGLRNLQGFEVKVTGELVARGNDLVTVFDNEQNRANL